MGSGFVETSVLYDMSPTFTGLFQGKVGQNLPRTKILDK